MIQKKENIPAIIIEDVSFTYPDKTTALRGISLNVENSEKIGIIGPNGSGKSTLITLLNGVQKANGRIEIQGIPISTKNISLIKSLVGVVFQNPDEQIFYPKVFILEAINIYLSGEIIIVTS